MAAGAVALAASGLATSRAEAEAFEVAPTSDWDSTWMTKIKGKYRQVFDAMDVHSGFPLVMTRIWLMTNTSGYNIPEKDLSAVTVLRHNAICMAMNDSIWAKYKLGEQFEVTDPATSKPAERNVFAQGASFVMPPFSVGAIDKLEASGVIFCACNMAALHFSEVTGAKIGVDKDAAYAEWKAGLLPGITLVPSGVLAVGRAQGHGCAYCGT
jgi:intracellular sulfur oxidation DsrE/DsrF family protein